MELGQLRARRREILQTVARHDASDVRVFGSVARGEAGPDGDIDVLINLAPERSLLDLIAIKHDLEDVLGCAVDVVPESDIHPAIHDAVPHDAIVL